MNIIVPSLALELKVREVAQEVSDTDTFYNLDGTEALVIGASQIHKIYEDNGVTYVLAKSFQDYGWEDVTDAEGGSAPDGPLAGQRLSDFNFDEPDTGPDDLGWAAQS